jgi:lipoprotein signal peptidase
MEGILYGLLSIAVLLLTVLSSVVVVTLLVSAVWRRVRRRRLTNVGLRLVAANDAPNREQVIARFRALGVR